MPMRSGSRQQRGSPVCSSIKGPKRPSSGRICCPLHPTIICALNGNRYSTQFLPHPEEKDLGGSSLSFMAITMCKYAGSQCVPFASKTPYGIKTQPSPNGLASNKLKFRTYSGLFKPGNLHSPPQSEEGSSRRSREGGGVKHFPSPLTWSFKPPQTRPCGRVFPLLVQGGEPWPYDRHLNR